MVCKKCNATVPDRALFCPACGTKVEVPAAPVETQDKNNGTIKVRRAGAAPADKIPTRQVIQDDNDRTVRVRRAKPEQVTHTPPVENHWEEKEQIVQKPQYSIHFISLALIVVCIALWMLVPFMAVNNYTLADQPTALALLLDDVDYIGELTDALAFWIAIVTAAGLLVCLVCVLLKSRIVTRVVAGLTVVPLIVTVFNVLDWADNLEDFFDFFGITFWVILVAMLTVLVLGGGWRKK